MNLFPHQQEILDLNPDRHLLAHGTGSGKSLMAIELAKKRNQLTLVVFPKHLKQKWQRDMRVSGLSCQVLTKEEFKKAMPDLLNFPTVIIDEAHAFFGVTSQMHKSLLKYFNKHNTPYRYLLSATPFLSTNWNVYAAGVLIGLPLNYIKFKHAFFSEVRMGMRYIWKDKRDPETKKQLKKILDSIGSSVQLSDVFDVPNQHHENVYLEMTPEQEKRWNECYDPIPITQWTRQHQVENSDGVKLAWLKEFAKTHKKFVIWCRYRLQSYELKRNLKGSNVFEINGDTPDRDAIFRYANEQRECILIINAQCSEGFELPAFDTAVYASMSFSFKDLIQSQGRLLRANALHENHYYYLIIEGGVDEEVKKALDSKSDFSFELLAKSYPQPMQRNLAQ